MKFIKLSTVINLSISMVDNSLVFSAILARKEAILIGSHKNMISKVHNSIPYKKVSLSKIALFPLIARLHTTILWNHLQSPSCLSSQRMKTIDIFIGLVMKNFCIKLNLQYSRFLLLILSTLNLSIKLVKWTKE